MKKTLTILITLILSICLINVDTNITKASGPNDDPQLVFGKDANNIWALREGDNEYPGRGETWDVVIDKSKSPNVYGLKLMNFTFSVDSANYTKGIKFEGTDIILEGNNTINVNTNYASCNAYGLFIQNTVVADTPVIISGTGSLKINITNCNTGGTASGIVGIDGITVKSGTINIVDEQYGKSHSYTSLYNCGIDCINSSGTPTVTIDGGTFNINLNRDCSDSTYGIMTNGDVVINGGKFNINLDNPNTSSKKCFALLGQNVEQNDGIFNISIKSKATANGILVGMNQYNSTTQPTVSFNYGDFTANIDAPATSTNGMMLTLYKGGASNENATSITINPGTKYTRPALSELAKDTGTVTIEGVSYNYEHLVRIDGKPFTHLELLNINVPITPVPEPEDKSCEKVIGPSWHWNEEKGVCEEYLTVGTYTR